MNTPDEPVAADPPASMLSADTANGESEALTSETPATRFAESTVSKTFRAEAHHEVQRIALVGDFNDWSPTATPMTRTGDHFEVTIWLQPGRRYQYKFLVDGDRWENDWHADDYVPNQHGGDDSVVDLTERRRP